MSTRTIEEGEQMTALCYIKKTLIIALLLVGLISGSGKLFSKDLSVDLVVFSKDRPLQLYAFLESVQVYLTGVNKTHVIYCTSEADFEDGYQVVKKKFPQVQYHKQSAQPHVDFKPLVLQTVYSKTSSSRYIVFGVDDIIVKDYANLAKCTKALEKYKAWGFFLRLGKNITYTYTNDMQSPVPRGRDEENDIFSWKFANGNGDWAYPNNVDMTIYKKESIRSFLEGEQYTYPNTLEGIWAKNARSDMDKRGLCFQFSKTINLPINIVSLLKNRCTNAYSIKDLLLVLRRGLKININEFFQIPNKSQHIESNLSFIQME
jgi:hypothetical protein